MDRLELEELERLDPPLERLLEKPPPPARPMLRAASAGWGVQRARAEANTSAPRSLAVPISMFWTFWTGVSGGGSSDATTGERLARRQSRESGNIRGPLWGIWKDASSVACSFERASMWACRV